MTAGGRRLIATLAGALIGLLAVAAPAEDAKWLITPEEAATVRLAEGDPRQPAAAKEGPGPRIVVRNPKALERVRSPVTIFVEFAPGDSGHPPTMKSLRVTLVGFIDIDLTGRVREYVRDSRLEVERANLPTGSHRIRMAIKDLAGLANERDLMVQVVENRGAAGGRGAERDRRNR